MTKFNQKTGSRNHPAEQMMAPDKTKHEREAPRTHFQSNKTNREAFREIPFFPILPILEFEKFNFGGSDEEKATSPESDRT